MEVSGKKQQKWKHQRVKNKAREKNGPKIESCGIPSFSHKKKSHNLSNAGDLVYTRRFET